VLWAHDRIHFSAVAGPVGSRLNVLLTQAASYKNMAFAQSTMKTYKCQTNCYLNFCLDYGLSPVPASQSTLCCYVAFLGNRLSPSSIKGYLNAVRLLHLEGGFSNPLIENWELNRIQRGILRQKGTPPSQKLPITVPILLDIFRTLTNSPADRAFWAACLVAYYGLLRKSTLLPSSPELIAGKFIACSDVVDLDLSSFLLRIRLSKTNQFGQRVLTLHYVKCGDVCPVRALLTHFGMSKLPGSRPLFNFLEQGVEKHFSHAYFMSQLRVSLRKSGNNAVDISCHSFRRGERSWRMKWDCRPCILNSVATGRVMRTSITSVSPLAYLLNHLGHCLSESRINLGYFEHGIPCLDSF
jgi:hypothetical protein